MKAVIYTRYGSPDVLRFTDVQKPTPKDNQVLVKVQAVTLNRSDWEALRGKPLYAGHGAVASTPPHPGVGHHRDMSVTVVVLPIPSLSV